MRESSTVRLMKCTACIFCGAFSSSCEVPSHQELLRVERGHTLPS